MAIFNNALAGAAGSGGAAGYQIERSLRFNSADGAYLSRTPSAGNRRTWTWSGWFKRALPSNTNMVFVAGASDEQAIYFNGLAGSATLVVSRYSGAFTYYLETQQVFRDPSAWYHIVVAYDTTQGTDTNRVKLYVNGVKVTQFSSATYPGPNTEYEVNSNVSHKIGRYADGCLADVHFLDGLTPGTTTRVANGVTEEILTDFGEFDAATGVWNPKAYTGSYPGNSFYLDFKDNSSTTSGSNVGIGKDVSGNGNYFTSNNISVWNGGAYQYSSTLTTSGSWAPGYGPARSFNGDTTTNAAGGGGGEINTWDASSYNITVNTSLRVYANTIFDGWSVNGTSQGAITSTGWKTASLTPPYTLSSIVSDAPSSHGSYFSAIEVDGVVLIDKTSPVNDSLRDSPTNGNTADDTGLGGELAGNYCTGNPLDPNASNITLSNGNLDGSITSGTNWWTTKSTIAVTTGKWYFEQTINSGNANVGVSAVSTVFASGVEPGSSANSVGYKNNGDRRTDGVNYAAYGDSFGVGDTIGCAFDMDNRNITFYKNGVSQGVISGCINAGLAYTPLLAFNGQSGAGSYSWNFGQRPFAHQAPSGFKCLCTANLDDPLIENPSTLMGVLLWTGDGASGRAIRGYNFTPDMVWLKSRGSTNNHGIFDRIRGASQAYKPYLSPNNPNDEATTDGALEYWHIDGFQMANGSTVNMFNINNSGYVSWGWDAGSSNTTYTAGVTPGAGSISSVVRANPTAGFSIVTYSGVGYSNVDDNFTVGHGLGKKPAMVIVKKRNASAFWAVWHTAFGDPPASGTNDKYIKLNEASPKGAAGAGYLFKDASTSDVFGIGVGAEVNGSGSDFVAYCFAPVEGYSAVTSFVGNGSTSGPFVHLGFRPKFILYKSSTSNDWWNFLDTERGTYNPVGPYLQSNDSNEGTASVVEIFSNGFRPIFNLGNQWNGSGQTYIVYAVAEHPFKYARAR
jgi:hypothetical protein